MKVKWREEGVEGEGARKWGKRRNFRVGGEEKEIDETWNKRESIGGDRKRRTKRRGIREEEKSNGESRYYLRQKNSTFPSMVQSKTCIKLLKDTFDLRFWLLPHLENLKTLWGLEREVQAASFKRNRSVLALFFWEISRNEVKNSIFSFCNSTYSLIIAKNLSS